MLPRAAGASHKDRLGAFSAWSALVLSCSLIGACSSTDSSPIDSGGDDIAKAGSSHGATIPTREAGTAIVDASQRRDADNEPESLRDGDAGNEPQSILDGGNGGTGGEVADATPALEPSEALFDPAGIARIDLALSEQGGEGLGLEPYSYVRGDVKVELSDGQRFALPDIGLRLKGKLGSLRSLAQKAGFLLKFNKYQPGQKLLGLSKLALNNMVQDPSLVHEQLAYSLFRAAGVPAPRTSYARVFVNEELFGLYALIEVIDNDEFLNTWYGDDDGNLYEGAYGSDLFPGLLDSFDQDRGDDVALADLAELTSQLDAMNDPDSFVSDASAVIDMERYFQFAATEIFIGHWDGYAWTRNNYHLYRGPDARWTFMPWGTDQTFGSFLDPFGGAGRLEQLCAASQPCRNQLAQAFRQVSERVSQLELIERVDTLRSIIDMAMLEDPRKEHGVDAVYQAMDDTQEFLRTRAADIDDKLRCTDPSQVDVDEDGASGCGFDCDDQDPNVYPGAPEQCNIADDDCDGQLDNDPLCPQCLEVDAAGGGRYAFCFSAKNFAEAEADCVLQGGHLAAIHDEAQQNEIVSYAYDLLGAQWWIGLSDTAVEGSFTWADGTALDFQAWNSGEPNNAGDNEDCAHLASWASGLWNDIGCQQPQPYVCALP